MLRVLRTQVLSAPFTSLPAMGHLLFRALRLPLLFYRLVAGDYVRTRKMVLLK